MLRVLLVEDNLGDVTFFKAAVADSGEHFDLSVARDGASGWRQIKMMLEGFQEKADLIILDLNLPAMSGIEILSAIAASQSPCAIPIVMFTSIQIDPPITEQYPRLMLLAAQKTADFNDLKQIVRNFAAFARSAS